MRITYRRHRTDLSKIIYAQAAALDDALKRTNRDELVAMHGNNHLSAVEMTPFLVTALLADHNKTVPTEDPNHFSGVTNRKPTAHGSAISSTFAPTGTETGDGSNQSSRASFAFRTASSSVSPAEAQPGNSGKKAAHRSVSGSCSITNLSFMHKMVSSLTICGKILLFDISRPSHVCLFFRWKRAYLCCNDIRYRRVWRAKVNFDLDFCFVVSLGWFPTDP